MVRRRAPITIAVIPARYGSTRLPGKPLLRESGKFLIEHVWDQVRKARRVSRILIASDDQRVIEAARSFGAEAVLTSPDHPDGTSRCWEAVRRIPCQRVLNVQGDEPEIDPRTIDRVAELLDDAEMSTAATSLADDEAAKPERVKVVVDRRSDALYFSRSRIPFSGPTLLHLGLYGFHKDFLRRFVRLGPTPLSERERLEQLRPLEHGHRIRVAIVPGPIHGGIDTPEDYAAFVRRVREGRAP